MTDFLDSTTWSPEEQELLELLLEEEGVSAESIISIPQRQNQDHAPLSFAQQRLWFLEQLQPGLPIYHLPAAFRLTGPMDVNILQRSMNQLAQRHASLRTQFKAQEGEPKQHILPRIHLPLKFIDCRSTPSEKRDDKAAEYLFAETQLPFDLQQEPLLRTTVIQLAADKWIVLFLMHHIIADGWSIDIMIRELTTIYTALSQNEIPSLPPLAIAYADFAEWQRIWLQDEILASHLEYWKAQLEGAPEVIELPFDNQRPAQKTFRGRRHPLEFGQKITRDLEKTSKEAGVTMFMTLLAAFKTLLFRYVSQDSIVVGTPVANRNHAQIEGIIGFFVNTLALHTVMSGNPSFTELLQRVKEVAIGAYDHQDLPFEKLVEELQPVRSLNYNPIFQVMFALQTEARAPLRLSGTNDWETVEIQFGTAKFDLSLSLTLDDNQIRGSFEYNADLFQPETIARMAGHFQTLVAGIVAAPNTPIGRLPLLTAAERERMLISWNDTAVAYPHSDICIHQLFEQQVEKNPDHLAVLFEKESLTYRQLNERANQLAHTLQSRGVGPDVLVGICVERSLDMVIGLLGILKAGGAYLPLDPAYPAQRLAYMLSDAQVAVLLTQEHLSDTITQPTAQTIRLDADWEEIASAPVTNPTSAVSVNNLAYVIYTSGSTGQPKGVMVSHRGVPNLAEAQIDVFNIRPNSRVLQFASLSFDASVSEVTTTLIAGATLVLAPQRKLMPGPALIHLLRDQKVTIVTLPPSALAIMDPAAVPGLKTIISAGEACTANIVARWAPGRRFVNAYGPTEATVCTTMVITDDGSQQPPIGQPINNFQVYLLDKLMEPVPTGIPGELYIGSTLGLARGYLNQPELTAQKFVSNPLHPDGGERLYRTGDLARYRPDGNIDFLGRIDHQVKIRGFRIELGEIETSLAQHPAIQEVVLLAREDSMGDKKLVAYIVPEPGEKPQVNSLRQHLKRALPEYMLPNAFVFLPRFPLTPNGKVNRQALPAPKHERELLAANYTAPRNALEQQLTTIWENILGIKLVGVLDNFFELGGHSLLAVRLFAQIEKKLGLELPIALLFQFPTVAQLAEQVSQYSDASELTILVPIKPEGTRPPFFCVHGGAGHVFHYHDLAMNLHPDQPFYGIQPPDWNQPRVEPPPVDEIAALYVAEMRKMQPSGPYYLGGYCFGGLIAHEMACQLNAAGEKVNLLALIEPSWAISRRELKKTISAPTEADSDKEKQSRAQNKHTGVRRGALQFIKGIVKGTILEIVYFLIQAYTGLKRLVYRLYLWTGAPVLPRHREFYLMNIVTGKLRQGYTPQHLQGKMDLFVIDRKVDIDHTLGWRNFVAGRLFLHKLQANHFEVLKKPHVDEIGKTIQLRLDVTQAKHSLE